MQSLITSKLDVLDPDTQMFLKIASVLGIPSLIFGSLFHFSFFWHRQEFFVGSGH
jgi:hypothetical protein